MTFTMRLITLTIFMTLLACEESETQNQCDELFANQHVFSLSDLNNECTSFDECGQPLDCENKTITLCGNVEWMNVFEDTSEFYIDVPNYESMQVYVTAESKPIFDYIHQHKPSENEDGLKTTPIIVKGTVSSFDAPTNTSCSRKIVLNIDSKENVTF